MCTEQAYTGGQELVLAVPLELAAFEVVRRRQDRFLTRGRRLSVDSSGWTGEKLGRTPPINRGLVPNTTSPPMPMACQSRPS
ncbi:hypothetical protein PSAC2689_20250 [Paraburkholderia sacchari]